jgi:ketopantoate reductase
MRILVVGAGATGGYFGGRLAQAGRRDVTIERLNKRHSHSTAPASRRGQADNIEHEM